VNNPLSRQLSTLSVFKALRKIEKFQSKNVYAVNTFSVLLVRKRERFSRMLMDV
jgi:hypothetical protein